jgi:hypothetical protein
VSPDLVNLVVGKADCLVCSKTFAKPASVALAGVGVFSLDVAGTEGVKLVL